MHRFIHSLKAYSSTLTTHQRLSKVLGHSNEQNGQGFCSPWACDLVYSRSSVLETRGKGRRRVWCTEGQGPRISQDPAVTLANLHQTTGLPLGVSFVIVCCCCLVTKSCLILFDPLDYCRLPGTSVHGISQAGPLEWVAISLSRSYLSCHVVLWIDTGKFKGYAIAAALFLLLPVNMLRTSFLLVLVLRQ